MGINVRQNIVRLLIFNLIIFIAISTIARVNNALADDIDLMNYTQAESVITGISSDTINRTDIQYDSVNVTPTEFAGDKGDYNINLWDLWDKVVDVKRGINMMLAVISSILTSQVPYISLYTTIITPIESQNDPLMLAIAHLFLAMWQTIIVYNWIKIIVGSRITN